MKLALRLLLLALLTLAGCSPKDMSLKEASDWVAAFPPAIVDTRSPIFIEFTAQTMMRCDSTKNPRKILQFSPKVAGVEQMQGNVIGFMPGAGFKAGQTYTCRVDLSALTGVDSLGCFAFKFTAQPRELAFAGVKATIDPNDIGLVTISGRIEYNSVFGAQVTADSSFIACSEPGARVVMDPQPTMSLRAFTITGIKRRPEDYRVSLRTAESEGFPATKCEVNVPSLDGFRLLDADRIDATEPYIQLQFSAPLSSQQDLEGLIEIDGIADLRFEREGTSVKVYYPANALKTINMRLSNLLRSSEGTSLASDIVRRFDQPVIPPAVEIPFDGSILPDNANLRLPFRAVNLAAVDVEVVKVYPSNVLAFLQENDLDESSQLRRFGRLVHRQTVRLDTDPSRDLHRWQDFAIDLRGLFAKERGAVYNILLTFRKAYSLYGRTEPAAFDPVQGIDAEDVRTWDKADPYIFRQMPDHDWWDYRWQERDDPSTDSYYMVNSRMKSVNLVASDLGLIAKRGENKRFEVIVTDLPSAKPRAGATVTAYDYQLQKLASATTDANGFASIATDREPFMLKASDGRSSTYLKVLKGYCLDLPNGATAGRRRQGGLRTFAYGDRGVWRPGDDLHLTLIVEDSEHQLPANHPVTLSLFDPSERLYASQVLRQGVDGFYCFTIPTDESAPTGRYKAQFTLGDNTTSMPVRIETIKPNRLKVNLSMPKVLCAGRKESVGMDARWLTGPVAKDMHATVSMSLAPNPSPFPKYSSYTFRNPLTTYTGSERRVAEGMLDSTGGLTREVMLEGDINAPGMLMATLTAKVAEPGGDASIVSSSVPFAPFGVLVGIDLSKNEFETDTDISFPVIVLNQEGARMRERALDYKIYRLDWGWWYEGSAADLRRYVKSTSADLVANGTVTASNGRASVPFRVDYPDWGRYLVLVRDPKGGHATGGIVEVDWPQWRGRSDRGQASGSTELTFSLDRNRYTVGDRAMVYLPRCAGGRALLSVETGAGVVRKVWVPLSDSDETRFPLTVDASMAPNFYVSATLLRPHAATSFDTPIRLFGVREASVVDPASILKPVIDMPGELHPNEPFTLKVSEKENKTMTYTLAIVDEGLLDITSFRTPAPWPAFNAKEALGVRTWDMFDDVIGTFGSDFRSIASVGGDEALRRAAGKEKRFNPAVRFLGPFTLRGGTKSHRITMPNYVGSVRVMLVAAHEGAYGHADRTVKVTAPLMVLPSLPRELACGDSVTMPVNVFAMEAGQSNVDVNVSVTPPLKVVGKASKRVTFAESGEKAVPFTMACAPATPGKARIIINATSGNNRAADTLWINVGNPMPQVVETQSCILKANGTETLSWNGTPEAVTLQIATMPAIDFGAALTFWQEYPHRCTEQLASKALFMLYGRQFLGDDGRQWCREQLPGTIKQLCARQLADGGFVYWPGFNKPNEWVTSMAGLALTEAVRQGFAVDKSTLDAWKNFQQKAAAAFRQGQGSDLNQTFRLYTLAVAGAPQKPAMNRLREARILPATAPCVLASTYALAGRNDVALKLLERSEQASSEKSSFFASDERDRALTLEAYSLCGLTDRALTLANKVAGDASGITQDIAFAAIAFSRLSNDAGKATVKVVPRGGKPIDLGAVAGIMTLNQDPDAGAVEVVNTGTGVVYATLTTTGRPATTEPVKPSAHGLKMTVSYADLHGRPIDPSNLPQDTEFVANIRVTNLSDAVDNMALTYAIPAGWEIMNDRHTPAPVGEYVDYRDTACRFYFSLPKGASKTLTVKLRTAYLGHYILPPTLCEDMYNPACRAITGNRRVVVRP